MSSLKQRWLSLMSELTIEDNLKTFKDIRSMYSESHRKYHTLDHLVTCFAYFDEVRDQLKNPAETELALWFHDYYYDFTKSLDELRSATRALEFLRHNGFGLNSILNVREHILATAWDYNVQTWQHDTPFVVDVDRSVLGADPETFAEYEANIRAEYAHVSDLDYTVNRVKILKSLLNANGGNVFNTQYFIDRYSEQAKTNIKNLIRSL